MSGPETHEEALDVATGNNGLPSPAAARQRLGTILRDLRLQAKLTQGEAGREIHRSPASMSRLERGSAVPRWPDIDALLNLYRQQQPAVVTDETRRSVRKLVDHGRESDWIEEFDDVLDLMDPGLRTFVLLETDAREFYNYEIDFIPGLLQHTDYARAIAQLGHPDWSDHQKDRFAEFRAARREHFDVPTARYVINESALRRGFAPPEVLERQLRDLLDTIRDQDNPTTIRVAPSDLAAPEAMGGPFAIMRFEDPTRDCVYIEHRGGSTYLTGPAEVERDVAMFDRLTAAALGQEESAAIIEREIKKLST
jgi:transcriptional regulator with XRE-family HTH domain